MGNVLTSAAGVPPVPKGPRSPVDSSGTRSDSDLVRSELDHLLRSDQFKNSRRCQSLLSYVVEETLAGRGDQLKERVVGVSVFGRNPAYDTAEDPVVRNAAIDVRKRLAQYYIETGKDAAVRIDLQPGTYIPSFRLSQPDHPPDAPEIPEPQTQPPAQDGSRKTAYTIAGTALALAIALAVLLVHYGVFANSNPNQSSVKRTATAAGTSSTPAIVAGASAVRILAGDLRSGGYIDRFGNEWSTDRFFSGGKAGTATKDFYFPPADPEIFSTMREGSFSYDIPLEHDLLYELRLYFVEPQFRYGNKVGGDGENNRIFEVLANGKTILNEFDIIEDAGFASTTVRAFKDIAAGSDGKLHLQFTAQRS